MEEEEEGWGYKRERSGDGGVERRVVASGGGVGTAERAILRCVIKAGLSRPLVS